MYLFLQELASALATLSLYDKGNQDILKNAVEIFLAQVNPAAFIPTCHSVAGAGQYYFCSGCQRLDVKAVRARTSGDVEVTLCSLCYDSDNKCPARESNEVDYVGVPTDAEKREGSSFVQSPYTMPIIQALINLKIEGGRTRTYDQFATELSTKFEELVSRGLSQFRFDDIRQFLILTKEQYNKSNCPKHFGKLIRYFVVLVAGQCCDCMRPVRGIFSEASGFFEINHVIRGLADYVKPSDDAAANGCVMLMDHILDHYNGEVDCKNCHKKDEHAHEQRGQNHPQAGVCLLCSDLREPLGSARTPILSPTVSSGYDHDVSDFDDT